MQKSVSSILTLLILTVFVLSACGGGERETVGQADSDVDKEQIKIVTTIFPIYDWVRNIIGDEQSGTEARMLLDNGVDLHSFQPTTQDIMDVSNCDLFIYVGGESDEWVYDALEEVANEERVAINLLDILGDRTKEEEIVEGMEEEEGTEDGEDKEDSGGIEYDEHVWLSLKNVDVIVEKIGEAMAGADPANAALYEANAAAYSRKLEALDNKYQSVVSAASNDTLLFGDRFPFRYMTDDYGLSYYAAFSGCSAETEASFETITFLAQKLDELSLHYVMTIEGTDHRIAETIIENTKSKDQEVLALNSMQSENAKDVEDGAAYLTIMEDNLSVLEKALQ